MTCTSDRAVDDAAWQVDPRKNDTDAANTAVRAIRIGIAGTPSSIRKTARAVTAGDDGLDRR